MSYVARTKTDRKKLVDNRMIVGPAQMVTLECGHHITGSPSISNPDRWWCCGGWRTRR